MKRKDSTTRPVERPQQAAILAFVATTWFALLPLIVAWNAFLEGGEPGVGLGFVTWLAVGISPVVGWAFAKNITDLGVEHAQRPAFAALILVGSIWLGGLYVHLSGAYWLVKCEGIGDADSCLAAGNYFDSGDAAFQGTIDAKDLWADACVGGGEEGWRGCRKIVHAAGYRTLACDALREHCHADDRNMGACWDWGVVCNRADFVDEEVDEAAAKAERRDDGELHLPTAEEQRNDYERCLASKATGVIAACDRTLDRGILHQRQAVCDKLADSCDARASWTCNVTIERCALLAANPFKR